MQLLLAANRAWIDQLARAGEAVESNEVVDLSSSSSESDWACAGDFHGPSHVFYSMQPPKGQLATTKRVPGQKGSKQGRLKGPGERDRTHDKHDGQRLGMETILRERGLLKPNLKLPGDCKQCKKEKQRGDEDRYKICNRTNCCMRKIISLQPDFVAQKTRLEEVTLHVSFFFSFSAT